VPGGSRLKKSNLACKIVNDNSRLLIQMFDNSDLSEEYIGQHY